MEPQTPADRQELEHHSELVLKAMINAAKADGRIDQDEMQRIVGKLNEAGMGAEAQQYVMAEMRKPMETQVLVLPPKAIRNSRLRFTLRPSWRSRWIRRLNRLTWASWLQTWG